MNKRKGISLIVLVITILVMIILAGVVVVSLQKNNPIKKAQEAKILTAVSTLKEELQLLQANSQLQGITITPEILLAENKVVRTVTEKEPNKYYMYYALKKGSFNSIKGMGEGDFINLKDVFLIDEHLNVRYIDKEGNVYGDKLVEKILENDTVIRFSNKNFAEYIKKISGAPTVEEIKFEWMRNLPRLTINDPSITSLEDLVFFQSLVDLELNNLTLDNLSGVEACTKLNEIRIVSCKVKDLSALSTSKTLKHFYSFGKADINEIVDSLKPVTTLNRLTVRESGIGDMSTISELTTVEDLYLYASNISKVVGLEKMKNLKKLMIANNPIGDISGIVKCTSIESLKVYDCGLTSLNGIEKLTNLKELDAKSNNITDMLPLAANTKLMSLNLKNNPNLKADRSSFTSAEIAKIDKIGEILTRGGEINLDVDKLNIFNNYTVLDLSNQNLTTLDCLEGITTLKTLYLNNNKISLTDEKSRRILAANTELTHINLRENCVKDVTALNGLTKLNSVYLEGNENVFDLKQMEDIIQQIPLYVSQATLNTLPNCSVSKINNIEIATSPFITTLPDLSKFKNLTVLNIHSLPNVTNFKTIETLTGLTELYLCNSNFQNNIPVNLACFPNLQKIDLRGNNLTSNSLVAFKPLEGRKNLKVYLPNNSIIDATYLLGLDPSTYIGLESNINLSQDSKEKLKERFKNNVSF